MWQSVLLKERWSHDKGRTGFFLQYLIVGADELKRKARARTAQGACRGGVGGLQHRRALGDGRYRSRRTSSRLSTRCPWARLRVLW